MSTEHPHPLPKRRRVARGIARVLVAFLAFVGLLPVLLSIAVRLPVVNQLIVSNTRALIADLGVRADYDVRLRLWPLSVELREIVVHSTDDGPPALIAQSLAVKPRFFSLLGGKPRIDEITLDAPRVRVVLAGKRIDNLGIDLPESNDDSPSGPIDLPFSLVSAANAHVDFTLARAPGDLTGVQLHAILEDADIDVLAEPSAHGSVIDVGLGARRLAVQTERTPEGGHVTLVDDDELCDLDARVSFTQAGLVHVRRLEAHGGIDMSGARDTFAGCQLDEGDKRRIDVSIGHLVVNLSGDRQGMPEASGRIAVRVPVGALDRIPGAPHLDGWVSVDAEIRTDPKYNLPQTQGRFQIHGIKVGQRGVVEDAAGEFFIEDDIVRVPELAVHIARGVAKVTEVTVKPFEPGVQLQAKASVQNANFAALLADLGVHPHPHVGWDLRSVNVLAFGGTIVPLDLNGAIEVETGNFGVYDRPAEEAVKQRIVGFESTKFRAGVHVQPQALEFHNVSGEVPGPEGVSTVEGGFVSIGFHDALLIEAPRARVHLKDIGPLGALPIDGYAEVRVTVDGTLSDPHLTGKGRVEDFVLGGLKLGTVDPVEAELNGLVLSLRDAGAKHGESTYRVPYARLDFGGQASVDVETDVVSQHMMVDDFFDMFGIKDDPRFAQLHGALEADTHVRVTMGGPNDKCGGGLIEVSGTVNGHDLSLLGEHFDEAHASFDMRWYDQAAGLRGADLNIRTLTAYKRHKPGQDPVGTAVGSVTVSSGGALRGNVVFESIPLSSVDLLGDARLLVSGSAAGHVLLEGDLDTFDVSGNVDVTPVRLRGTLLDSSELTFRFRQEQEPAPGYEPKKPRLSRCGLPIGEVFSLERYKAEQKMKTGDIHASGRLFGGQIQLKDVGVTREESPVITGKITLDKLDLSKVLQIVSPPDQASFDNETTFLKGELSGELDLTELRTGDLAHSRATFLPKETMLTVSGQKIRAQAPSGPLVLGEDRVTLPALIVQLESAGLRGTFLAQGTLSDLMGARTLDVRAELEPIDLGILAGVVPKVTRAGGMVTASAQVTGTLTSPVLAGTLAVRDGAVTANGVPGAITNINLDLTASANELRVTSLRAKFAGGTVTGTARMPIRGNTAGTIDSSFALRDLHLTPISGVKTVLDADLAVTGDLFDEGSSRRLPRLSGSVLLSSLEYSRPINLDVSNNLSGGARRTQVDAYDPEQDLIALDVNVRSKAPLRVRNNLADFQLALDGDGLIVSGTNQRIGMRGELRAVQGGKLRFLSNEFDLRQASIRFEDPTHINPYVDLLAVTEYRRVATTSAAGAGRASGTWRISLHAYGPADALKLDMTSEPTLTQEDISLLLTVGLTKAEADSLGGNAISVIAYEAAGTATGADRAVKKVIPIDDFRFGSAYSPRTGRSEPNITVGKRLSKDVQASVTSGFTEDRAQKATVEWRLSQQTSVAAGYDNINNISSTGAGNVGFDFRWRLEFE